MSKSIKCPFCSKRYTSKELLYNHIQLAHPETLKDETYTPARVYFNFVNKKDKGSCVMCKESTEWNEHTRRYMRFCGEKCKEKYVKMMKDRMINTYGKAHLLNDPEKQKEMLQARSISGGAAIGAILSNIFKTPRGTIPDAPDVSINLHELLNSISNSAELIRYKTIITERLGMFLPDMPFTEVELDTYRDNDGNLILLVGVVAYEEQFMFSVGGKSEYEVKQVKLNKEEFVNEYK